MDHGSSCTNCEKSEPFHSSTASFLAILASIRMNTSIRNI